MVEEAITAEPAASPTVQVQAAGRHHAAPESVRAADLPLRVGRVPAQIMPHRVPRFSTPRHHVPQLRTPRLRMEVGDRPAVPAAQRTVAGVVKLRPAVVRHTATAAASNSAIWHQAAEAAGSAALPL